MKETSSKESRNKRRLQKEMRSKGNRGRER